MTRRTFFKKAGLTGLVLSVFPFLKKKETIIYTSKWLDQPTTGEMRVLGGYVIFKEDTVWYYGDGRYLNLWKKEYNPYLRASK